MERKTIIFFSRCELTQLYGKLSSQLEKKFNIIHVAYSHQEKKELLESYSISDAVCFNDVFLECLKKSYSLTDIEKLDNFILKRSNGRFNLNSSLQSDRTLIGYDYEAAIQTILAYKRAWELIFSNHENLNGFFIHEPVALSMTQMAAYVSKDFHLKYLTNVQVYGVKKLNWIFCDGETGELHTLANNRSEIKKIETKTKKFIENFRLNRKENFFSFYQERGKGTWKSIEFLKLIFSIIKNLLHLIIEGVSKEKGSLGGNLDSFLKRSYQLNPYERIKQRIDRFLYFQFSELNPDTNIDYYYYPIHMEPEATVLYWANGTFKNQVKLIENIAAQLPPNTILYVKDHPHGIGNRVIYDYFRIQAIPNVILLEPAIPGLEVTKVSKGVITINGTTGLEGALLGKQVFILGSAFYDYFSCVIKLNSVFDLRIAMEDYYRKNRDDDRLIEDLSSLLMNSNEGFTDYFSDFVKKAGIDEENNLKDVLDGFLRLG